VARLDPQRATWGYVLLLVLALLVLAASIAAGALPGWAALGFIGFLPALPAARTLIAARGAPAGLAGAIKQTILAAHLVAVLTAVGLVIASP
jgi:1,4-dihydroxy-2-naphthoate octaprenyltransferase